MRNNYKASEMVELGEARKVILGSKPEMIEIDALYGVGFREQPLPDDIDESDE